MFVTSDTIGQLAPELILLVMAAWIYLGGAFGKARWWWIFFSVLVYVSAWLFVGLPGSASTSFTGPLIADRLGDLVRTGALGLGILFTLLAGANNARTLTSELVATLMLLIVGIMLVSRANDLVFLFVSLELVSIPTYVLLYVGRRDRVTAEASVKYFFLSILSSGLLLYGLTWLYGIAGTTVIVGSSGESVYAALSQAGSEASGLVQLAPVALCLIVAGLGFKIAAVPFHFYAPDVYQGATNANAGLLAIAPKIAGMVALLRLVVATMSSEFAWELALVLALLTMTIGNVCALWQHNLRRMMAYSSIAHAGYMLMGVATALAGGSSGVSATLFYLIVYVLASFAMFAVLAALSDEEREVSRLEEIAGLGKTKPAAAGLIAVCMFSLAGIPPLAGFWGKFALFSGALRFATETTEQALSMWFVALAVGGALNAAIAAAYYLRVVAVMFFQPARIELGSIRTSAWLASATAAVMVIAVGVFPRSVERASRQAEWSAVQAARRPIVDDPATAKMDLTVPDKK